MWAVVLMWAGPSKASGLNMMWNSGPAPTTSPVAWHRKMAMPSIRFTSTTSWWVSRELMQLAAGKTFIDQEVGEIAVSGGTHNLRVAVDFGEFNINWITLSKASDRSDARTLIWRDEFDTLDRSIWQHNPSEVNGEIQTYTDDPKYASVRDGILTLSAIKEDGQWRSARFRTKGKKEFNFGSFETRVKNAGTQRCIPCRMDAGASRR